MFNVGITGMRKEIQMKQKKQSDGKDRSDVNHTTGSETTAKFTSKQRNNN